MICPKCGCEKGRLLALSRVDNKTMICDECGLMEALESIPQPKLKKINITLSLYFKIQDSELFDYDVGYADVKIDLDILELETFDLQKYAQEQTYGMANLLKVSPENVRIISRREYDENTEES